MAGIKYSTPDSGVSLPWVGDELTREHVLAGGVVLEADDYTADASGRKYAQSGSLVGRTYAERDAGRGFGPVAIDGTSGDPTDDEVYLLLYDVYDVNDNPEAALYRHTSLVHENKLPADTDVAAVRANYQTIIA